MKELSIEEKAKAYDEVLKKARMFYKDEHVDNEVNSLLEVLFPELKVSEGEDDKMRNFVSNELACLRATDEKGTVRYNELTKAIDWLEKQKSEEINLKALLTADKLAAAEMTGRLKEREDIVENPHKYGLEKQGEQKPAWSEEDARKISLLDALCDDQINGSTPYSTMYREIQELKDWLKSLKDRYTWKPTEEAD